MVPSDTQEQLIANAVRRVLGGDTDAYYDLHKLVDRPLRAFIRSRSRLYSGDFVNEAAHRTHVFVFQNLHKYDPERGPFLYWLFLQARNAMRLARRKRFPSREVQLVEEVHEPWAATSTGPAEEHEARRRIRVVREEIESLAGDCRATIELHDLQDLTLPDAARELGIAVGRLRYQRDRALTELRRKLVKRDVHATVRDITPVLQIWGWDQSGYDDDWTSTASASLPVGPQEPLSGKDEKESPV